MTSNNLDRLKAISWILLLLGYISQQTDSQSVPTYDLISLPVLHGPNAGYYTNVRLQTDGFPSISYFDATSNSVNYGHCIDGECSNFTTTVIDGRRHDAVFTTGRFCRMQVGMADQLPVLSYRSGHELRVAHCNDHQCQNVIISVIDRNSASGTSSGAYTSMAFDNLGNPVIGFFDEAHSSAKYARCFDPACSRSIVSVVQENSTSNITTGKYIAVAWGSDGLPVFSYYVMHSFGKQGNIQGGYLSFAKCMDQNCTLGKRYVVLDNSSFDVGRYTNMVIGVDGLPIIMYSDETTGQLRVIHCNNNMCSNFTKSLVDFVGKHVYGFFPEIQVSPITHFPVMSYFDQTNSTSSNFKFAQCENAECSSAKIQVVAQGGCGFGRDSSISFNGNILYLSFLQYSAVGLCKARLAVLQQSTNVTKSLKMAPRFVSRNEDNICVPSIDE